jgi:uncharacterized protein (TIGR01777 family)
MKILMTGATGLLGNLLGQALVERGHQITITTRTPESARARLSFPCEILQFDVTSDSSFSNETSKKLSSSENSMSLSSIDTFIHLAGEGIADKKWTNKRKQQLRDSRVRTAEQMISKLNAAGAQIKTVITASGIGIYGDRGDEELDEQSAPGENFVSKLCLEWESTTRKAFPNARWIALRTAPVLSTQGGYLEKVVPIFKSLGASILGNGKQYVAWIHVEDWVRLTMWSLENLSVEGPINATAPEPVRNSEWTERLAKALATFRSLPVPAFALKIIYGELAPVLFSSQRATPRKALAHGFRFLFPSPESAFANLFSGQVAGEFKLVRQQWVPRLPHEIFDFFATAENLGRLTPEFLGFQIIGKSTPKIQNGTLIDYKIKVHGIPMRWRTEISDWQPGKSFHDEQLKGPYSRWSHTHGFRQFQGGTVLSDEVIYKMPLGRLGLLLTSQLVRGDVNQIFNYRAQVIAEMFMPKGEIS